MAAQRLVPQTSAAPLKGGRAGVPGQHRHDPRPASAENRGPWMATARRLVGRGRFRRAASGRECAGAREQAQQVGRVREVGALRRLIPHQYACPPRLQAIGKRADFIDSHRQSKLPISHDERSFLVVVRAVGGVAAPSAACSTNASKYSIYYIKS